MQRLLLPYCRHHRYVHSRTIHAYYYVLYLLRMQVKMPDLQSLSELFVAIIVYEAEEKRPIDTGTVHFEWYYHITATLTQPAYD